MTVEKQQVTLDVLLDFVKRARGFDFTGYKRSTIERRVAKRMGEWGVDRYEDYVDHLELHPEEFAALFNTILINVTGFFRDPATWEYVARRVVPELVALAPAGRAAARLVRWLRVGRGGLHASRWCSRARWARRRSVDRVKIYATDIDEEALDAGAPRRSTRRGSMEDVPARGARAVLRAHRPALRRSGATCGARSSSAATTSSRTRRSRASTCCVCRNTLMYFNAETQERILRRFQFALDDDGVLLLGKSEMLHHARRPVPPRGHQAPHVPEGRATDDARPRPRDLAERSGGAARCRALARRLARRRVRRRAARADRHRPRRARS